MAQTLGELSTVIQLKGAEALATLLANAPVLVLRGSGPKASGSLIQTPADGLPPAMLGATEAFADLSRTVSEEDVPSTPWALANPTSLVIPIRKTERNPFMGVITVGRARNNDMILTSARTSKLHAFARRSPRGWEVEDNNSSNGTFINNLRLEPKTGYALRSGDELWFADVGGMFLDQSGLASLCTMIVQRDSG